MKKEIDYEVIPPVEDGENKRVFADESNHEEPSDHHFDMSIVWKTALAVAFAGAIIAILFF